MKCSKCWFCTNIGAGIYADYPLKYCKYKREYKLPFVWVHEKGVLTQRQLDFSNIEDCKIWNEVGCNIHPNTVKKVKNAYIKELMEGGE